jgi:hypothetical protein
MVRLLQISQLMGDDTPFHDFKRTRHRLGDVLLHPILRSHTRLACPVIVFKDADGHKAIPADVDYIITDKSGNLADNGDKVFSYPLSNILRCAGLGLGHPYAGVHYLVLSF